MSSRVNDLLNFLNAGHSVFHVVENMRRELLSSGYEQLLEGQTWNLKENGRYFTVRNGSALIAFRVPKRDFAGFQIMASHADSPGFRVKENPEMTAGPYVKLNTERYGGFLGELWFDRPLSVAGRVMCRVPGGVQMRLVDVDRDLLMIPSMAIHLNREAAEGQKLNPQKDLLPLYGMDGEPGTFRAQIAEAAGVAAEDLLSMDLYLYNRQPGTVWGANREFVSAGRLDDLQCAFASFAAFLEGPDGSSVPMFVTFDNEEVGSSTKQGAASTFLLDTLTRICESLGRTPAEYRQTLASSFMVSADNSQGLHPNYPEKFCPTNQPKLNGGIVLKYNAAQSYTTDAVSGAIFQTICEKADVPLQTYANRSDMRGGSTLGNISGNQVAVNCVDIGLAQLSMHSPYETAGVKDVDYLIEAAKVFFASTVVETGYGTYEVR